MKYRYLAIIALIIISNLLAAQSGSKALLCPNNNDVIFSQVNEVTAYDQLMYSSPYMEQIVAQHLSVSNIVSVRFFGSPINCNSSVVDFTIEFYEDNNGDIGEKIEELSQSVSLEGTQTGDYYYGYFPIYYWDWTPSTTLSNLPEDYFISIQNNSQSCHFAWYSSPLNQNDPLAWSYSYSSEEWSRLTDISGEENLGLTLCVRGFNPEPLSPDTVSGFIVDVAPLGELKYNLNWTNPAKTYSGEQLSSIDEIVVSVNNDNVSGLEIDKSIEANNSFTDLTVPADGYYSFKVIASNSYGSGAPVSKKVYIGEDLPGAVQNLTAKYINNNVVLSWDEPSEGEHQEYFNPDNITNYIITRSGAADPLYEITTKLSYVDSLPVEGVYTYTIYAENGIGEGMENVVTVPIGYLDMFNGVVSGCDFMFYDDGGEFADFSSTEEFITTIYPSDKDAFIQCQFLDFNLNSVNDFLEVYNGEDTTAQLLGRFTGNVVANIGNNGTVIASNNSGALTFYFKSDYYTQPGWKAHITCLKETDFAQKDLMVSKIESEPKVNIGEDVELFATIYNNTFVDLDDSFNVNFVLTNKLETVSTTIATIDLTDTIKKQQFIKVPYTWIPEEEGKYIIEASVFVVGDEDHTNNKLYSKEIEVDNFMKVGGGTALSQNPFCFVYQNSVIQNLYTKEQLNGAGKLKNISYTFRPGLNLPDSLPFKLWIGETSLLALNSPINADLLTKVYDGYMRVPATDTFFTFEFTEPYTYSGANSLVVLAQHPMNSDIYFDNYFEGTIDSIVNHSYVSYSNNVEIDPYDLTTNVKTVKAEDEPFSRGSQKHNYFSGFYPNVILQFDSVNLIHDVLFTVKDENGALEGAQINIDGKSLYTNSQGQVSGSFMQGAYSYSVNLTDYIQVEGELLVNENTTDLLIEMEKIPLFSISGRVLSNSTNSTMAGAKVLIGGISIVTGLDGGFLIDGFRDGDYVLKINLNNHNVFIDDVVVQSSNIDLGDITMIEIINKPVHLQTQIDSIDNTVNLSWGYNEVYPEFYDDFESYEEFSIDFAPWTLIDVDQAKTYGFDGMDFSNAGEPNSGIIFNTESVYVTGMSPTSGNQLVAIFNSIGQANNDWIISPKVSIVNGYNVSFMAKAFDQVYYKERFQVLVSEKSTIPDDFVAVSEVVELTDIEWNQYSYDLSAYAGKQVYVAIHCTSNDQFILLLDDFSIGFNNQKSAKAMVSHNIYLNDMETPIETNVFGNEYLFAGLTAGKYVAGVQAIYSSGESEIAITEFEINTVSVNNIEQSILMYPNPTKGEVNMQIPFKANINISDATGKLLLKTKSEGELSRIDISHFEPGIYFFEIVSNEYRELFKVTKQ